MTDKSPVTDLDIALAMQSAGRSTRLYAVNHRGELGVRHIVPQYTAYLATPYHPTPQWSLRAFDLDKKDWRDFPLANLAGERFDIGAALLYLEAARITLHSEPTVRTEIAREQVAKAIAALGAPAGAP